MLGHSSRPRVRPDAQALKLRSLGQKGLTAETV
jgi:hypothetical protein